MPASRPGGLQLVPLPPHSRSRGGLNAGSSDQPGRRNPHTATSTRPTERQQTTSRSGPASPGALPPEFIQAAKRLLVRQRDFRIDQLSQLDAAPPTALTDGVRAEVHERLLTAARNALADIDEALRRIEQGGYGRCHACGARLSHARLAAIPMARMCSGCQRALDENTRDAHPAHSGESAIARTNR
jgi:DnaK suppressor protein